MEEEYIKQILQETQKWALTKDIDAAVDSGKVAVLAVKLVVHASQAIWNKWIRFIAPACIYFHGQMLEMPYAKTKRGTMLEDWTKKIDAIFCLCIAKDNDIKSLTSLNGQGTMEQLGLLTSYFYLIDAKYANKLQPEQTKYLEHWQKNGAAEDKGAQQQEIHQLAPSMKTTKQKKVKEDMIASVKEQVLEQGAGLTGGVVGGGDFGGIGSVLKDFVALAQPNMILGFGAGSGGLHEEMAKTALLKHKTENINSQLVLEQRQLELARMQLEVKCAEKEVAADVDRQSVVVPSTPATKAGASAPIDFSSINSSNGKSGDCDDDE